MKSGTTHDPHLFVTSLHFSTLLIIHHARCLIEIDTRRAPDSKSSAWPPPAIQGLSDRTTTVGVGQPPCASLIDYCTR
eukprot:1090572-Pyramimonas_sp.AAC.1